MSENLKESIVLLFKITLYSLLFAVFFIVFALKNVGLTHLSRTLVITMSTFVIIGILMLIVYGNFRIGEEKSKPIIFSMMLAVLITDVITYLQLMIMNTNPANNIQFKFEHLDLFLSVFIIQMLLIALFSYKGNDIYFKLFNPRKTLIIFDKDEASLAKISRVMNQFKLQYQIENVVNSYDNFAFELIQESDFVVLLDMDENRRNEFAEFCYDFDKSFTYEASLPTVVSMSGSHVVYDDKSMVDVQLGGLSIEERILKRVMDIILSSFGLILTLPILILVAVLIKLDDQGPVFFRQDRFTKGGKIFKVIKFRSMKQNVENYSATENDDRITRMGHILRKTRLDELPQLINVLVGDMSVVGPRPEMIENVEKYEQILPEFRYRLKVKGGVTGIAQIEGKYNTSPMDKLLMDLVYIENYSIWNDIKLVLRTLVVLFKSDSTEGFDEGDL